MSNEQTEQLTPYQHGLRDGAWTMEQLQEGEWASPQVCLEHMESLYVGYCAAVAEIADTVFKTQQQEYFDAWIESARQSLRALMSE